MARVMTLAQAETARRRAVIGLQNLGRSSDADYYESLTAEEYAQERGIDLVGQNPGRTERNKRNNCMPRSKTVGELREEIEDLQSRIDELEQENADLSQRLDDIAGLAEGEEEGEEAEEEQDEDNNNGY